MSNQFPAQGAYSKVVYEYVWQCAKCSARHVESYTSIPGEAIICVAFPLYWSKINNSIYCPKHSVVHLVDGAAVHV